MVLLKLARPAQYQTITLAQAALLAGGCSLLLRWTRKEIGLYSSALCAGGSLC